MTVYVVSSISGDPTRVLAVFSDELAAGNYARADIDFTIIEPFTLDEKPEKSA